MWVGRSQTYRSFSNWSGLNVVKPVSLRGRQMAGGHSVVVIEHDLDLIAEADWVVDLGPGGGDAGGCVVASSPPDELVRLKTATGGRSRRCWLERKRRKRFVGG